MTEEYDDTVEIITDPETGEILLPLPDTIAYDTVTAVTVPPDR